MRGFQKLEYQREDIVCAVNLEFRTIQLVRIAGIVTLFGQHLEITNIRKMCAMPAANLNQRLWKNHYA